MIDLQVYRWGSRDPEEAGDLSKATQHYGDLIGKKASWCTLTALPAHGKKKTGTQSLRFWRTILWASYHGCKDLDGC